MIQMQADLGKLSIIHTVMMTYKTNDSKWNRVSLTAIVRQLRRKPSLKMELAAKKKEVNPRSSEPMPSGFPPDKTQPLTYLELLIPLGIPRASDYKSSVGL
jgi:hypothetical protein